MGTAARFRAEHAEQPAAAISSSARRPAWRCSRRRARTTSRRTSSSSRADRGTSAFARSTIRDFGILRIGVQLIGDDFANTPPAHALANRGMMKNIVGFTVYGDYREANPPRGSSTRSSAARWMLPSSGARWPGISRGSRACRCDIVPVSPQMDLPYLPFVFDIAMGVRRARLDLSAAARRNHRTAQAVDRQHPHFVRRAAGRTAVNAVVGGTD